MFLKKQNLKNKIALVTGAGNGIGKACAIALAEAGASLIIVSRTKKDLDQVSKIIKKFRSKCISYVCDVTKYSEIKSVIDSQKRIDILVNNASNDQRHSLEKITEKYWDDRMAINLKHYLFAIQSVKKSMIKNKGGSIINLGSVSWVRGAVMFPAYSIAKAGIHGLTKSLARDLGKHNIRINSIAPGSIATARQSKLWLNPKFKQEILKNQALKKQLLPEDVSKMVLFLASDVSSGCTKQNFTVDAGLI